MIESQLLRIGNYVAHKDQIFKVISIQERYIGVKVDEHYGIDVKCHDLDPVPLSAELFKSMPHHVNSKDNFEIVTDTRTFIFNRYNNMCWNIS